MEQGKVVVLEETGEILGTSFLFRRILWNKLLSLVPDKLFQFRRNLWNKLLREILGKFFVQLRILQNTVRNMLKQEAIYLSCISCIASNTEFVRNA